MQYGMQETPEYGIEQIINKYAFKMISSLEIEIGRMLEKTSLEESYITQTRLLPDSFFDNGDTASICSNEKVILKKFGETIVIFNDLKDSTAIIEFLEKHNALCIYVAYIKYSSELLAEVLGIVDGKLVECTGDGNYSLVFKDKELFSILFFQSRKYIRSSSILNNTDYIAYNQKLGNLVEMEDIPSDELRTAILFRNNQKLQTVLRFIFYIIFAAFNIKINNKLIEMGSVPLFYSRVGCAVGECFVSRLEIEKHILQDKLYGSIIHKAAHQASGK